MILINNNDDLLKALEAAQGGEVFHLAGGEYELNLNPYQAYQIDYAKGLTFKSLDPDDPATFTTFSLTGSKGPEPAGTYVSNIRMEGVEFKYDFEPGHAYTSVAFTATYVSGLEIVGSSFVGDFAYGLTEADNGFATGRALNIRNSEDVLIEGTTFKHFWAGLGLGEVKNAVVKNSTFTEMRSEGINLQQVQGLLIDNNEFSNFYGSPNSIDHRDMIQMWSVSPTITSKDIVISNNVFDSGDGSETQSIFLNNEHVINSGDENFFYENIRIENNIIYNAQFHGITVGQTNGLVIAHNTLLQNRASGDGGPVNVPSLHLHQESTGVSVLNNLLSNEPALLPNWESENNLILDGTAHDYTRIVNELFADALKTDGDGLADLYKLPGTALTLDGIGADFSNIVAARKLTLGLITISEDEINSALENLKISLIGMVIDGQPIDISEVASVTWTLDGVAVGSTAELYLNDVQPGQHTVTGLVQMANGQQIEASKTFIVADSLILSADIEHDFLSSEGLVVTGSAGVEVYAGQEALVLNGGNVNMAATASDFVGKDEITLTLGINFETAQSGGYPLFVSGGVSVNVTSTGIQVGIGTSEGGIWLHSSTQLLGQPGWQELKIEFSSRTGEATLKLGDSVLAQAEIPSGAYLTGNYGAGVMYGFVDPSRSFDGHISGLEIKSYIEGVSAKPSEIEGPIVIPGAETEANETEYSILADTQQPSRPDIRPIVAVEETAQQSKINHTSDFQIDEGLLTFSFIADNPNRAGPRQTLAAKDDAGVGDGEFAIYLQEGTLKVAYSDGIRVRYLDSKVNVEAGKVYEVGFEFGLSGPSLWLNGELLASAPKESHSWENNLHDLTIGMSEITDGVTGLKKSNNDNFFGQIYELQIFDQAVTSLEIIQDPYSDTHNTGLSSHLAPDFAVMVQNMGSDVRLPPSSVAFSEGQLLEIDDVTFGKGQNSGSMSDLELGQSSERANFVKEIKSESYAVLEELRDILDYHVSDAIDII